ncbi:MAG: 23S rRNA (guanosine(2251)-2'-O)-methyltransferase RlmB [Myxococcota bacterium]
MSSAEEYIYGINSVQEALTSHPHEVKELLLARDRRDPRVQKVLVLAEQAGLKVHPRPTEVLSKLAGNDHHQGLVAVVKGFRYASMEELVARLEGKENPLVVLLDNLQDPQNLGALIRSALVMGAEGVIIPQDRAAGVTPAARKASAGAIAHIPVVQVVNLARTMETLFKEQGLWMVGLDQTAPSSLEKLDLKRPLGLVVGGEEKGMRPLIRKHCQLLGSIPQADARGGVDSLNAGVAGAIALYEVMRQRRS